MKEEYPAVAPAQNYKKELSKNGSVEHTIKEMKRIVAENHYSTENIANYCKGADIKETCENIWHLVRDNIEYIEDSPDGEEEILRTPQRTWQDKAGDCDCFTIFVCSILENLNIKYIYRVATYTPNKKGWEHIYPVAIDGDYEYPIDCVPEIEYPLTEEQYQQKKDIIMNTYELGNIKNTLNQMAGVEIELETETTDIEMARVKTKGVLMFIKNQIGNHETELAKKEIQNVDYLLQSAEDPEQLVIKMIEVIDAQSAYSLLFEKILNEWFDMEDKPTTVAENLNGLGGFPWEGALSIASTIGGSLMQIKQSQTATDNQAYLIKEQAAASREALAAQKELLQMQKEIEQTKQQNQNQNRMEKTAQTDAPKTETPPPAEDKNKVLEWLKKYWWIPLVGLVLIIGSAFYFFSRKKSKEIKGVKRKSKARTNTTRKRALNGVTKRLSPATISRPKTTKKRKPSPAKRKFVKSRMATKKRK